MFGIEFAEQSATLRAAMSRILFFCLYLSLSLIGEGAALRVLTHFPVVSSPLPLVEGRDGAFYGSDGYQTIFRVTSAGDYRVIYRLDGSEGEVVTSLAAAIDGHLYGTTRSALSGGVVFRLSYRGEMEILSRFFRTDSFSYASLVAGRDGNLYGFGSFSDSNSSVFRLTTSGVLTSIADFPNDGVPTTGISLLQGSDGALWGRNVRQGVLGLFRVELDGTMSNPIKSGSLPSQPISLVEGANGDFYITTDYIIGPDHSREAIGSLLRLTPAGVLTEVKRYPFPDLDDPDYAPFPKEIIAGHDGIFYGISDRGGVYGEGEVYRMNAAGICTSLIRTLHHSTGGNLGKLTLGHDGALYGIVDGSREIGTIFQIRFAGQVSQNLAPYAREDVVRPPAAGESVKIHVLANDRDADGKELSIAMVGTPKHGTAILDAAGRSIIYTASSSIVSDEFTYTIADGKGGTAQGRVILREPVRGNFHGLISGGEVKYDGFLEMSLSPGGGVSGRLWLGGVTWSMHTAFDSLNHASAELVSSGGYNSRVSVELVKEEGIDHLRASIVYDGKTLSADLTSASRAAARKVAGYYTVLLPANPAWQKLPVTIPAPGPGVDMIPNPVHGVLGNGFASMRVQANGRVRTVGRLPNGSPFAASNQLDSSGNFGFFSRLDINTRDFPASIEGSLSGHVVFQDRAGISDADAALRWRPVLRGYGFYVPPLIDAPLGFIASRYLPPRPAIPLLPMNLTFAASNAGREVALAFYPGGELLSDPLKAAVVGKLSPASGLVHGRYLPGAGHAWSEFHGVLLQKQQRASGLFLIPGEKPGGWTIQPAPGR